MGVISDQARSPGDVMRRLAELERAVEGLRNARRLENAAIGKGGLRVHSGGSVRIQDGGHLDVSGDTSITGDTEIGGTLDVTGDARLRSELQVRGRGRIRAYYPDTDRIAAYFGDLASGDEYIGSGIATWEPSGEVIMVAKSDPGGSTHSFGVRDNQNMEVLAVRDSTTRGLAAPAFTINCGPRSDYTAMPGSDSSSWSTIYEGGAAIYSPRCNIVAQAVSSDSGTSGQARLVMTYDGTEHVLTTRTDISFGYAIVQHLGDVPSQIPIGGYVLLQLQVRRTSGTGKIHGAILQSALIG